MNIKKILVPTDFSTAANNALLYAIRIAEQYGAQIDIIHALPIELLISRGNVHLVNSSAIAVKQNIAVEKLEKLAKKVSEKSKIKFTVKSKIIHWQMDLSTTIHDQKADLIVLGTTGATGLKKIFMGSNAASIMQHSPVPVLAIPENTKYPHQINIGFAYDGLKLKEIPKLAIINSFRQKLNANVCVFQIKNKKLLATSHLSELLNFLQNVHYAVVLDKKVETGILKSIKENDINMLVMIPRQHNLFHDLLNGSITERVAFKIPVPMLAIPE